MHQISGDTHVGKVICKRHKVAIKKKEQYARIKIKNIYNKRMST